MKREIEELLASIDQYLAGELDASDIEQETLKIISNDRFEDLDDRIQDAIYALDSKELNEFSETEVQELRKTLVSSLDEG